jgi:hypothetical protein
MPSGLAYTGYILCLIGGIVLIIQGAVGFLSAFVSPFMGRPFLDSLGSFASNFLTMILGFIAMIGSRYVGFLWWAVGLLVIGLIGTGLGGLLVLVGAILGLVHTLSK